MGDVELVRAYQAGSLDAFDQLFLRYHQAIAALTNRLLRDPLLAEDLTQETFFRVLRSLDRIDDSFNFSAWIHRIATNLCYDEMRRRKRGAQPQSEAGPRVTPAVATDPDDVLRTLPSTQPDERPEEALAMRELRREVWKVAAELPDNYRMALTLRELQGMSYSSIARAMGVTESAVETLIHRARRRFKMEFLYLSATTAQGDEQHVAVAELLGEFGLPALRKAQRATIKAHIATCPTCQEMGLGTD